VFASEIINMVELVFCAKEIEACKNLSAVDSTWIEKDFDHREIFADDFIQGADERSWQ
jgi:hypothetical protein